VDEEGGAVCAAFVGVGVFAEWTG